MGCSDAGGQKMGKRRGSHMDSRCRGTAWRRRRRGVYDERKKTRSWRFLTGGHRGRRPWRPWRTRGGDDVIDDGLGVSLAASAPYLRQIEEGSVPHLQETMGRLGEDRWRRIRWRGGDGRRGRRARRRCVRRSSARFLARERRGRRCEGYDALRLRHGRPCRCVRRRRPVASFDGGETEQGEGEGKRGWRHEVKGEEDRG